jgi:hypothetical protein
MEFFMESYQQNTGTLEYRKIITQSGQDLLVFTDGTYHGKHAGLTPHVVFNLLEDTRAPDWSSIRSCRAADLAYLEAYTPDKTRSQKEAEIQRRLMEHPLTAKDLKQHEWDNRVYEITGDISWRTPLEEKKRRQGAAEAKLREQGFDLRVSYYMTEIGCGLLRMAAFPTQPEDFKEGALEKAWNAYLVHNPSYGQEKPVVPSPSVKPPRHNGP